MKRAAYMLLTAAAVGGTLVASPAVAGEGSRACPDRSDHPQLVCGSDTCLRLETMRVCDGERQHAARSPAHARRVSTEEWSQRRLEQLIASID